MEIKILSIESESKVFFKCSVGGGAATWQGNLPLVGESIDVELDVDDCLEWTVDICTAQNEIYKIVAADNHHILTARVVSQEMNVLIVDFVGSVIMLEVENMKEGISGWVDLYAKELTLSPTNI